MDYVEDPHKTSVKKVEQSQYHQIVKLAQQMLPLLSQPRGKYEGGGLAVSHCQVEKDNPLAFFVTLGGSVIVNPRLTKHGSYKKIGREGCLSYSDQEPAKVPRYHKCQVSFTLLEGDESVEEFENYQLSGNEARLFQHEIDHMQGVSIYQRCLQEQSKPSLAIQS